jgi:hypothetical protein
MGGNQTAPGTGGNTGFALCGGEKTGRDTSYSKTRAGIASRGLLRHLPAGLVSAAVTLTMALLLLSAVTVPAWSADASDLKNTIEGWVHGGSGDLSAEVSDNTVTVTGEVTGANSTLTLDIDSGVTVVWKATLSSAAEKAISVSGAGTLEIAEGGVVRNDTGIAIYVEDTASEVEVTVSGGEVSVTGTNAVAILAAGTSSKVTVSGNGIVQATAGGRAIETKGCVEIKDNATVSATTDRAISAKSGVTVNGGSVRATGDGSYDAIYTEGNVIVSGGTVSVTGSDGLAIYAMGTSKVTVSGGVVYAFKNIIIHETNLTGVVYATEANFKVTGTGMVIACGTGSGIHILRSAAGIAFLPEGATAYWDRKEGKSGISYANGENTGFIPIEGVTLEKITLAEGDLNYTIPVGHIYNGAAQGIGSVTIGEAHSAYFNATTGGTITVKYAGSTTAPKDAGTYEVTAEISGGTEYAAVSIPLGEYTIAKREITLTADDKTVAFGSALPELTYTVSNLADGETVSDALIAEPVLDCPTFNGSAAGTYPITISGGTATGNYAITSWINGTLTVSEQVYTVIFDLNGGTRTGGGELIQTIVAGGAATAPTVTRSGYTFSGWDKTFDHITSDITVTALWSIISSGDGGSSSGTPDYVASVSGDGTGGIIVAVDKDAGTASAKLSDTQGRQISDGKSLVVTLPSIPGVTVYSIVIPVQSLSSAGGGGSVQLNTEVGSVTIPSNMLNGTGAATGGTAQISIGTVDSSSLPESARAAVGSRPVVSFTLYIDGKQTDWNNPDAPVTVSIPYTPAEGEDENAIVIYYIAGNGDLICVTDGRYDPENGCVSFSTTHFSDYAVGYNPVSFGDVAKTAWYYDAVTYLAARGITRGTDDTTFSPDMTLTRGQFIVLLLRAYNITADEYPTDNFSDAGDTYYTGYLAAAKRLGISKGVGDNKFAPEQAITRQEMFTLLYNTLKAIDALPKGDLGKTLSDFTDSERIASYAEEALTYLVGTGVVSGYNGALLPQATAARAEMAQVLYNLLKN